MRNLRNEAEGIYSTLGETNVEHESDVYWTVHLVIAEE